MPDNINESQTLMNLRIRVLVGLAMILTSAITNGQSISGYNFNKVTAADFENKNFTVDTILGAVIVADIGRSYFEGNTDGWFTLVYKVKRRVKIIEKRF